MTNRYLVLEDGSIFEGEAFGYSISVQGEVVFTTGMSGYQESLADPSSMGQILVMTYPLIGNYGVDEDFYQSRSIFANGLVVREYCKEPSAMYGGKTLNEFLVKNKTPGISGIDTRDITIKIRNQGTMKGMLIDDKSEIESSLKELQLYSLFDENMIDKISCKRSCTIDNGKEISIGLIDCGGKDNLIKGLSSRFNLTVFPFNTPSDIIIDSKVKGVIISDGPGDPSNNELANTTIKTISNLSSCMPLFGICLGGQLISKALGGSTYKMKFGHHGSNQPVKYGKQVFITTQNHGFAIDEHSLDGKDLIIDQINVNDKTVEGFRHKNLPIFTSQYSPDLLSCDDTSLFIDRFENSVKGVRL